MGNETPVDFSLDRTINQVRCITMAKPSAEIAFWFQAVGHPQVRMPQCAMRRRTCRVALHRRSTMLPHNTWRPRRDWLERRPSPEQSADLQGIPRWFARCWQKRSVQPLPCERPRSNRLSARHWPTAHLRTLHQGQARQQDARQHPCLHTKRLRHLRLKDQIAQSNVAPKRVGPVPSYQSEETHNALDMRQKMSDRSGPMSQLPKPSALFVPSTRNEIAASPNAAKGRWKVGLQLGVSWAASLHSLH